MAKEEAILHEADVLVIGGGMAGCFAAIKAREAGAEQVIQLDKGHVGKTGCSAFAAGIMHMFRHDVDDYDKTFLASLEEPGPYIVDQERLKVHLETFRDRVKDMASYGVEFERTPDGKIEFYPSRGIAPTIMFHGPQNMEVMAREARQRGVKQFHKTMMTDLLTKNGQAAGALAFNIVSGEWHVFKAKATVLATGSNFYKGRCPGHRNVTGDGFVAAYQAGTDVSVLDFAMHNAFPARYDIGPGMGMYVGTGGKFVNAKGERFMEKYAPELKDRSLLGLLVSGFAMEVHQGNAPIYLDMTHFTPEQVQRLRRVLPLVLMMYERGGLVKNDRFLTKLEWMVYAPVARGGVLTNIKYETCLPGLFACGDATPHAGAEGSGGGAALPGAATSGAIAGKSAAEFARQNGKAELDQTQWQHLKEISARPLQRKDGIEPDHVLLAVQDAILPYGVFLMRDEVRLKKALAEIEDIRANLVPDLCAYDPHYLRMALEAKNIATCAEMQLRSSLFRKETRGGNCIREDYPFQDNSNWLKWVSVKKESDKMTVIAQDIPIHKYPVKPPRDKTLDPIWQRAKELGIVSIKEGRIAWA